MAATLDQEVRGVGRMFVSTPANSAKQRFLLYALIFVWIVLELGTTFSEATPPNSMWWIRVLVAAIISRAHGIETGYLQGIEGGIPKHDDAKETDTGTDDGS